jgi:hypothetical protein
MSEQRLKVESGPPDHIIAEAQAPHEESGQAEQVKDKAQQAAAPAKEKAEQVKEQALEAAGPAKEKAREVVGEAKSHAQVAAGQVKGQAAAQVDEKSTLVGQQIGSQGEALEGVAGELRRQGQDGPARIAEQAAEKVKDVGEYLERADGEKLVETAQQVARDNPAAAAAVGAAAGFAAGRVIKASLGDGEQPQQEAVQDQPSGEAGAPETGAP